MSRSLRNGAAAFVIALVVWWGLSVPYTRLLASITEVVLRLSERPAVTFIRPEGTLMIVDRSDFAASPSTGRFAVESTDITGNFILLMTLFAATTGAASDRNVFGLAAAALALVAVHVAAVIAFVKADYATAFGAWSAQHYGMVSRSFWVAAPYFYSVVGVYGSAFALWWLFRPSPAAPTLPSVAPRRRRVTR